LTLEGNLTPTGADMPRPYLNTLLALSMPCWCCGTGAFPPESERETNRYIRIAAKSSSQECTFTLDRSGKGWSIHSETGRGATKMIVSARYDAKDRLQSAEAKLSADKETKSARVEVADGKAKVLRDGKDPREFDAPAGVIVTSAPDWTDTFLLCKRYDRGKGGKQKFAGLWIHPERDPYQPTFLVERTGSNKIQHDGKTIELDRVLIELRPKNQYVAWADDKGRMIKLAPLPFKDGTYSLVLAGYEKSAAGLRPE
jgi:hypothetical protein